jgi:hypothetical protein
MVKDCSVMMLVTNLIAQFCAHVVQVSIIQPEQGAWMRKQYAFKEEQSESPHFHNLSTCQVLR